MSITVAGLTLTRAVSRIPLPFSAMSTICCFTAGRRRLILVLQEKNTPRTVYVVTLIALWTMTLLTILHDIDPPDSLDNGPVHRS